MDRAHLGKDRQPVGNTPLQAQTSSRAGVMCPERFAPRSKADQEYDDQNVPHETFDRLTFARNERQCRLDLQVA